MLDWKDVALSVGVLALAQLDVWVGGAAGGSWAASLTLAIAALLLLARRQAPIAVAFGVVACQFACSAWAEPDALTFGLAAIVAWYSVGRWSTGRRPLVALAVMLGLTLLMVSPDEGVTGWLNTYLAIALTSFVVPWLVGYTIRSREARNADVPTEAGGELDLLSPREREVFELLARGATNAEIAQELVLSVYTVKAHVASILAKLGLRDRVQVVVYAHGNRSR